MYEYTSSMSVCKFSYMDVYMYVRMYICRYVCMYVCRWAHTFKFEAFQRCLGN